MSDKLQEIRERLEKATPGPWIAEKPFNSSVERQTIFDVKWDSEKCDTCGKESGEYLISRSFENALPRGKAKANAHFIAHAPTDITYLLGQLERLTPCQAPDHLLCDNTQNHPQLCHCGDPVYWKQRAESAESRLLLAEKLAETLKCLLEVYKRLYPPNKYPQTIIKAESALSAWEGK